MSLKFHAFDERPPETITPLFYSFSEISPIPPQFTIPNLLHTASLTLLASQSGLGKTTLACILAAAVSPPYYQQEPDPTVLLISPFADTQLHLAPRFQQLGINTDRVRILYHIQRDDGSIQRHPATMRDFEVIHSELEASNSYRVLIIDSVELFFDLPAKPSRSKLMHQLYRLLDLAKTHNLAILFLANLQNLQANPFTSTLLCCLNEAARTTYILARAPENPNQRLLLTYKNTLNFLAPTQQIATLPPPTILPPPPRYDDPFFRSMDFSPHPTPLPPAPLIPPHLRQSLDPTEDLQSSLNRALITPYHTDLPWPDYLQLIKRPKPRGRPPQQRDFACEVLTHILATGPKPLGDRSKPAEGTILHEFKLANLSFATAQRAKRQLNIQSIKLPTQWLWQLPTDPTPPPNPTSTPAPTPQPQPAHAPTPTPANPPSPPSWLTTRPTPASPNSTTPTPSPDFCTPCLTPPTTTSTTTPPLISS